MPITKLPGTPGTRPARDTKKPTASSSTAMPSTGMRALDDDEEAPSARFEAVGRGGGGAARAIGAVDVGVLGRKAGAGARAAKAAVLAHGAPAPLEGLKRGVRAAVLGLMLTTSAISSAFAQVRDTVGPAVTTRTELLLGKVLPQDASKVARTPAYDVHLAGRLADGSFVPDLKFVARTITDPDKRATISTITPTQLAGANTADEFKRLVDDDLAALHAFLNPDKATLHAALPEADRTSYALINIRGQRVEQLFMELSSAVERAPMPAAEKSKARMAVNQAFTDQTRDREIELDGADTKTYWSYGHDAPFVKVWERLLESLPEGDARRPFIQKQIDFIFTHKYVTSGGVDENDAEKTMGVVAIDASNRHVVSMTPETADGNAVRYETLKITTGPHAGEHAFRDGQDVFVEGTRTKLAEADVATLKRTPAGKLVFRRAAKDEQLRAGFRFDWNGNRMLEMSKINTGWWGHCDIQAMMEALLADMRGSGGVREFNAATGGVVEFTRDHQLEALASMLNFGDAYVKQGGGRYSFGAHAFAGSRYDDVPTRLELRLDGGRSLRLDVKLTGLSERGDGAKAADLDRTFSYMVPDEKKETFARNDTVKRVIEGDISVIDGADRKIEGALDGWTFDEKGRPVEAKSAFTIDLTTRAPGRVLVGSELTDLNRRALDRYYYDTLTRELLHVPTEFRNEGGKYVAIEGAAQALGKLAGVEIGREMKFGDDAADKLEMLERAARTGLKHAQDSDPDMQVWNGAEYKLKITTDYRSPDGKWERIGVKVDARFGAGKVGEFMRRLDDDGKVVETIETKAAVDFFWSSANRVAPLISERGELFLNEEMLRRGIIDLQTEQSKAASLGALQDMADIIYLGLNASDGKQLHTIVVDGKRLVYDDVAKWRADVLKLRQAKANVERKVDEPIADADAGGLSDTVRIAERGALSRIHVDIDVEHPNARHLAVDLTAPDGTTVRLFARDKGTAGGLTGTFGLDLDGAALAALKGKQVSGDWTLKIVDDTAGDVGTLKSWGLHLDTGSAQ